MQRSEALNGMALMCSYVLTRESHVKMLLISETPLFVLRADASYVDPLGPQVERPKTGAKKRVEDDDFADEELGDDLLPE